MEQTTAIDFLKYLNEEAELKNDESEDSWPEPEELRESTLLPVETITQGMIPEVFRDWLVDISSRMQCPLDFVGAAAIVATGALIGAGCGVRPKARDDWTVIPNLWGGIIARPSMLKSPSLAEVMKPLGRLEAEAKEQYEFDLRYFEADAEAHKAQREALKSDMVAVAKGKGKKDGSLLSMEILKDQMANLEEPVVPIRRRYKTNDSTIEKLGEILNENPCGVLIFRDELIGLLCSWDREDRKQDRAFYLEAWNGNGSFTTDRIGRGTLDIANCCVSILGGIQPSKLLGYLQQAQNDISNDGMIQRFQLLVYPDEPTEWQLVDKWPDKGAKDKAWNVFKKLSEMDFFKLEAEVDDKGRPFFRFSSEGQTVFNEWLTELETKLREPEENPLMVEHLAKYRSLMPSLALIFHLLDIASGSPAGPVSEESALLAAGWCEYLESHARRIYGIVGNASAKAAASLAVKIKNGIVQDGFAIRDLYRKGWTGLDTRERVTAACQDLEEAGWLRSDEVNIPNRQPKKIWRVNLKIFAKT